MPGRIARAIAVRTALEVRLEDAADDVDMVEHVRDALEHALARLGDLAFGQLCRGRVDHVAGPGVVASKHAALAQRIQTHFRLASQYNGIPADITSRPASTRLPNFGP